MNLFDIEKQQFKFNKQPLRLFEAFAGIGTQAMALKRIGIEIEHVGISEIDKYAIASYNAIHGDVKNYGDISKINGKDLPQIDLFTWSFPCTDLSKAGKKKGLHGGTRSGLAYEVLRIIKEMPIKPTVLVMENVPDLISKVFKEGWQELYHEIEMLGYSNHVELLNAKDYGVAQNRNRVFMVSIMGDYSYSFPNKMPLEKRLKDYLMEKVEEKYYLTDRQMAQIVNWKSYQNPFNNVLSDDSTSPTITTRVAETDAGGISASMIVYGEPKISYPPGSREFESRGLMEISPTLRARDYKDPLVIYMPTNTEKGFVEAKEGDGVYINRPQQKRGVVQKGMIQTIKAHNDDVGVVVKDLMSEMIDENGNVKRYLNSDIVDQFDEGDSADLSYPNGYNKAKRVFKGYTQAITCTTVNNLVVKTMLRIRKLTPMECWRLMGISDEDFYKAQSVCSNSQLYKQAGNAIVVDVLASIFKKLF